MADEGYRQVCIRLRSHTTGEWFVHPDLRSRLIRDAREQGTNLSEVMIQILARKHGVSVPPTGRRGEPKEGKDQIQLRLPAGLAQVIGAVANARGRSGWTLQDEIRHELCDHYGLRVPARVAPPRVRPRAPRPAPAA